MKKTFLFLLFILSVINSTSWGGSVPFPGPVAVAADGGPTYENFSTYTETPSLATLTESATRITWATYLSRGDHSYVYVDKGANHFNGNFVHQFEVYISDFTNNPVVGVWGVSSDLTDCNSWTGDGIALVFAYDDNQINLRITEAGTPGTTGTGAGAWSLNTLYFVTVTLDWDGGTNSTGLVTA